MSCKDCEDAQKLDNSYYYRWDKANIEMRGCKEHIREIMEVLSQYQRVNRE